jgi:carboxyl-terminal processing protease
MGEGTSIGFDAMHRATIVGTEMARLRGATYGIELPNSHIGVQFPAEKIFHVNGTPRENFEPRVKVNLEGKSGDPILAAALGIVRK